MVWVAVFRDAYRFLSCGRQQFIKNGQSRHGSTHFFDCSVDQLFYF